MNNEQKFSENVNLFLDIVKNFNGSTPIFSIQYRDNSSRKRGIYVMDCASGFIRDIQAEGGCTHLSKGALSVDFF